MQTTVKYAKVKTSAEFSRMMDKHDYTSNKVRIARCEVAMARQILDDKEEALREAVAECNALKKEIDATRVVD